jgi:hypothetical protein
MNPERTNRREAANIFNPPRAQPGTNVPPEPDDLAYALNHLIEAEQHLRQAHHFLKAARRGSYSGRMKPRLSNPQPNQPKTP